VFTEFKLAGSSLALMRPGERGVITKLRGDDSSLVEQLMDLGLVLGLSITLEEKSPTYVLKSGESRLTLDKAIARSIYVRLAE
jgi:ferrous iron transport protein A